jgi:hypothetical protein
MYYSTIWKNNQLINFVLIVCKGKASTLIFSLCVIVELPDDDPVTSRNMW